MVLPKQSLIEAMTIMCPKQLLVNLKLNNMENTGNRSEKLWIGVGIITVISGIGLALSDQYEIGISGSIVGLGLVLQNMKQIKEKNSE